MFKDCKPGDIFHLAVYDCFEGDVKLLIKGINKSYIKIIDVLPCYPCQKPIPAGEKMWIEKELVCEYRPTQNK